MPLKDITDQLSSEFGFGRSAAVNWANRAGRQLYNKMDLHFAKREQLFDVGSEYQMVALPYYVDKIIHFRLPETLIKVEPQAYEPKFQRSSWIEPYLEYRVKQRSAINRDIVNAAQLTFTLAEANSAVFTITIQGGTANSTRINETLVVPIGSLSVTSAKNYETVKSIQKSATTDSNITVTDINGNVMSIIPNDRLSVDYQIVQVMEPGLTLGQERIVDCLYRVRYEPLVNDNDLFCDVDLYDDAVYWFAKSLIYEESGDRTQLDAQYARNEAIMQVTAIDGQYENYTEQKLQFNFNQTSLAFRYPTYGYGTPGYRIY